VTAVLPSLIGIVLALMVPSSLCVAQSDRPLANQDADTGKAVGELIAEAIREGGFDHAELPPRASSEEVRRWAKANREALQRVTRGGLGKQPWGPSAGDGGGRVFLYVFDWHASGKLVVYGLTGGVRKAYLLGDPAKVALPAARVGSSTVFTVPAAPPHLIATVVVLEVDDELKTTQIVSRPGKDGRIVMNARDVVVHGRKVRYEPEPHKDTVGYWTERSDWVSWDFEVSRPGTYSVEILQGCGKGSGGSTVRFSVGDQALPVSVQDTGGFQNFVSRNIGELAFAKAGLYTLDVKPVEKAGKAVMDLRSVTLRHMPVRVRAADEPITSEVNHP
jgi:hypothetical protein